MESDPVNVFRMRPVYDWVCEGDPEEFVARLTQLVSFDPAVDVTFRSRHAILSIPEEAAHTWSPVLDVTVLCYGDDCHVHARLGPSQEVWALLVFLAAVVFFPCFFAAMFGCAQYAMGETPWGLLGLPIGAVGLTGIYATSFFGKKWGADQIHQLLAVVEANLSVDAEFIEDTTSMVPKATLVQGGSV